MSKGKLVFHQTLMISTAILFLLGACSAIYHVTSGAGMIVWQWYMPMSIVITGLLCALTSLLLWEDDRLNSNHIKFRIGMHFVFLLGIVSLCGYMFHWYIDAGQYRLFVVMYVLIYGFVWAATLWIAKTDENRINEAIKEIQDEE